MKDPAETRLVGALIRRAASIVGASPDDVTVDRLVVEIGDSDLFSANASVHDIPFDSLALVELLDIVEEELDQNVFDVDDADTPRTLRGVAVAILATTDAGRLETFLGAS